MSAHRFHSRRPLSGLKARTGSDPERTLLNAKSMWERGQCFPLKTHAGPPYCGPSEIDMGEMSPSQTDSTYPPLPYELKVI